MKTVITFGVFDFYHLGHLRLFRQIRQTVGEPCRLIVAVQKSEKTLIQKPEAKLLYSTEERCEMLAANRYIDQVITYEHVDDIIGRIEFDILARAQEHRSPYFTILENWCNANNKDIIITQRTKGISSTLIRQKIAKDLIKQGEHFETQ